VAAEMFKPEVVPTGHRMPKLNGYDAAAASGTAVGKGIYLVALTGWGKRTTGRRTEEVGFNHHMVKPVDPDELMKLLASLHAEPGSQPTR